MPLPAKLTAASHPLLKAANCPPARFRYAPSR